MNEPTIKQILHTADGITDKAMQTEDDKDHTIAALEKELAETVTERDNARKMAIYNAKRLADLRAIGPCPRKHPRQFWVEADTVCENCARGQSKHRYYGGKVEKDAKCNNFRGDDRTQLPGYCAICADLSKREADAHAETAAMLEKAAGASCDNCAHWIPVEVDGPTVRHWYTAEAGKIIYVRCMAPAIRALIPTSYAAALAERVRQAVMEEAEWWHKGHICENSKLCEGCLRLGIHRAARQAPEEKEPNP